MKNAGSRQIAERYVRALFETAGEGRMRDAVEKDLGRLACLIAESAELRDLLANPLLSRDQQAAAMRAVLDAIKAQEVTFHFIATLAEHKRLPLLAEIAAMFAQWAARARGEITAHVVSARALGLKEVAAITEHLSKAVGKKVMVETSEDESLLGGALIRIGSRQLDSSLAGKLKRLGSRLKAA